MNITQIENTVTELLKKVDKDTFIYDLLLAYGKPKSNIKRLKSGDQNMSKTKGEVSWKKEVFFKAFEGQLIGSDDLDEVLAEAVKNIKHKQRFVIVTDFKRFLALDTKTIDRLDIEFKDLGKNYAFFLPWAGMEKAQHLSEHPADVKASERMAKLFDELKKDNPTETPEGIHNLNVFLSRLLFCFFAEDTNIFEDDLFTNAIDSHTQKDGSDVHTYLNNLFDVLNLPEGAKRNNLPEHLKIFPYVNGGLFDKQIECPKFSKRSRQILIDSGGLDWKDINPDIFGSMFQAVITVDQRGTLGQHYTSVPNIMKVIQPLFLDELYEAFEEAKGNIKKINILLNRLQTIKIFDPACGSGNFLIIAYKELRKLEMLIFKETGQLALSGITLTQFYGIEIDDFAHEIAILALWLAEHQMNVAFYNEFGRSHPPLPLKSAGNIAQGNACRLDWEQVCPKEEGDEIYILGNPPYLGAKVQNKEQKEDVLEVTKIRKLSKNIDYISIWFIKATEYIASFNAKCAFVSTSSIAQGEQVPLLWDYILKLDVRIFFAHHPFKWKNNAKRNAGVTVNIIGLSGNKEGRKTLQDNDTVVQVDNINAYLIQGKNVFIEKANKPLNNLPLIYFGSMPRDGGYLMLNEEEKEQFINSYPSASQYILNLIGSREYIRGENRYCIWVEDDEYEKANKIEGLNEKFNSVKEWREESKASSTQKYAEKPYRFVQISYQRKKSIIIPCVSSELREYIPIGFIEENTVINNKGFAIYDFETWQFALLTSRMHMVWVRTVAGRLETRLNYTASQCYNAFPSIQIAESKKSEIEQSVKNILRARANHSQLTLAQMYDPDKMPKDLREAHHQNDLLIDSCYREKPFESDEERLEHLFKLYEKMIAKEQRQLKKDKLKKKPTTKKP